MNPTMMVSILISEFPAKLDIERAQPKEAEHEAEEKKIVHKDLRKCCVQKPSRAIAGALIDSHFLMPPGSRLGLFDWPDGFITSAMCTSMGRRGNQ